MRTVVIVLLDPACDALLGLVEGLVFVEPHLLFFQAAMEPLEVTVALGMVVSRAPMFDGQPVQGCASIAHRILDTLADVDSGRQDDQHQ
jgi:hypothetical protein